MLRTVKLLALVAMFFVALSASAQVVTSALSDAVTNKKANGLSTSVLHTPSEAEWQSLRIMDDNCYIQDEYHGLPSFLNDITPGIHSQHPIEDGDAGVISGPILALLALFIVSFAFILFFAILKGKNIKIKCAKFNMEIGSKIENED